MTDDLVLSGRPSIGGVRRVCIKLAVEKHCTIYLCPARFGKSMCLFSQSRISASEIIFVQARVRPVSHDDRLSSETRLVFASLSSFSADVRISASYQPPLRSTYVAEGG